MFRTQFDPPIMNYGRQMRQIPCDNFEPNQGRKVGEVIQDFVQGIAPHDFNLSGYATVDEADAGIAVRGVRQLGVDNAYCALRHSEHVENLEQKVKSEEVARLQAEELRRSAQEEESTT